MDWAQVDTKMGTVYLIVAGDGLTRCTLPVTDGPPADIRSELEHAARDGASTDPYVQWLERYFAGDFPVGVPALAPAGNRFARAVWRCTAQIPAGSTASYGEIAARAGHPRAARAVGGAMARNPVPLFVPCHRVIRSDGKLGGFGGGIELKCRLLRHEGISPPD